MLVVNGTSAGERLPPVVQALRDRGYLDVRGVAGGVQAPETRIYHVDGFAAEADVVARDLGFDLDDIEILPVSEGPPIPGIGAAKVIVYLGPGALPEPPPITEPPPADG